MLIFKPTFSLSCIRPVYVLGLCLVVSDSLQPYGLWPTKLLYGNSSGKTTGVGCHAFLQGIFQTQGLNPGLPHCRQILYHLSHQGIPRILEEPGDLPDAGIKLGSPALQADSLPAEL